MSTRSVWWICFFCFSLSTAFAQSPVASAGRQITLNVVVTDRSGKPVGGLEEQDFTILDNKHPQKILSFQAVQGINPKSGPPVQVILLMDEVNTRYSNVAFERQQVDKFLGRDGGVLSRPVSLAFLSDSGVKVMNPSEDGNSLSAELNANQAGLRSITRDQGIYGASDRFQISLNAIERLASAETSQPGRKLVLWISPGWPILTGPEIQLSSKDQRGLFGNIVALSNGLRMADVTVYSIDPIGTEDSLGARTTFYEEFLKGVKKPGQVQIGDLALQVLAVQSGGRVFNSNNDIASEIAAAIADANDYYILTFEGLPADGPDQYHSIEVKTSKSGLKAITRTGYYAEP